MEAHKCFHAYEFVSQGTRFVCFLEGIWSSDSLGKPWQRCKAGVNGTSDGACSAAFAFPGVFSSGKQKGILIILHVNISVRYFNADR